MESHAVSILINKGNDLLNAPYKPLQFTRNPIIDKYLNDLDNFPHFFVLACIMDRQMKAENAWKIPHYISKEIGSPNFKSFANLTLSETHEIFNEHNLHRFKNIMAICFYQAVQRILHEYNGYASRIWRDDLSSITIMRRFLQFDGAGVKIASMATNILIREFKLPIKDKSYIDISPDIHVRRVFTRLGFIHKHATNEDLIYCARSLYPDYPSVFDLPTWEVGRNWCKPNNPDCNNCYLNTHCRKDISNEIQEKKLSLGIGDSNNNQTIGQTFNEKQSIRSDIYTNMKNKDGNGWELQMKNNDINKETSLTEVQGINLRESVEEFRNRIKREMVFKGERTLSFPGGASDTGHTYELETVSGILSITVLPDTEHLNRYMHFVNLDQPKGTVASDVEINIPKVLDRRASTLLAKNQSHRYICNRGKCTVYMSSLKKSVVLDHFASKYGNVDKVQENGKEIPVILVADLNSEKLFDQIALFTHQIKTFKNQFR